jgi:hypothetical protein
VDTLSVTGPIGMWLLPAHIFLAVALAHLLRSNPLREELFAYPRSRVAAPFNVRFFRVRYFLPWVSQPAAMHAQPLRVRLIFALTRVTGAGFLVCFVIAAVVTVHLSATDA